MLTTAIRTLLACLLLAGVCFPQNKINLATQVTGTLATGHGGTGHNDTTYGGTSHVLATTTGTLTNTHCVSIDASGNFVDAGAACGSGSGTVTTTGSPVSGDVAAFSGSTSITSATSANIINLFTGCAGTDYLGADGACHTASGTGTVTSFSAGTLSPLFTTSVATATTTPALSFVLSNAAAHTFFGNNTGVSAAPAFAGIGTGDLPFTYSGNTTKLGTVGAGSLTSGHIATWDASGNLQDGGAPGGTGTVTSIATTSPVSGGTITTTGTISCPTCAIGPGTSTTNHLAKFSGTDGITLADGGAIPTGTVTSIATTSPITGGTITSTGTIACATCAIGPGSSTANHLAKFSGTDGITLADGGVIPTTGALVLLEQHTASSSTTLDFTTCISSTYDDYQIDFVNLLPGTVSVNVTLVFSTDGGAHWDTTTAHYGTLTAFSASGSVSNGAVPATTSIQIAGINNNRVNNVASAGGVNGSLKLYDPLNASSQKTLLGQLVYSDTSVSGALVSEFGFRATYTQTTAVNAFQLGVSSGNLASGTVRCYGVAK